MCNIDYMRKYCRTMWIMKIFKKQGGIKLLKEWYHSKNLLYAFLIIPFFISSKIGLEIFRLAIGNRTHRYLSNKFKNKKIENRDFKSNKILTNNNNSFVWFMWLQGLDGAPELVKANFNTLIQMFGEKNVRLVTENNLYEYIDLPDFIKIKKLNGTISPTHFSDVVRIQLLTTYGGMWVDATVFFSDHLPAIIMNQDFFVPQTLKPGKDGKSIPVSNWLMISKKNNAIAVRIRDLLFYYWKNNNNLLDYFIFHHFIVIAFEELGSEYDKVLPYDNTQAHALLIAMKNQKLSEGNINNYITLSPIHKLTNKVESELERKNQKLLIEYIENRLRN